MPVSTRPATRRAEGTNKTNRGAIHTPRPFRYELPLIRHEGKMQDPAALLKERGWQEDSGAYSRMFWHPDKLDGNACDWEMALRVEGIR